ncbi:hypothetical protein K438DRAFT_1694230 [Mycena galopus ATCC 62051]|nr:hypothetical protein K438DRAFT_1694230 [Mycena galopus ATCC 62051]
MSTTNLPLLEHGPTQSAQPVLDEHPIHLRWLPQATGDFVAASGNGSIKLRLSAQEDQIEVPVYGISAAVAGSVELLPKTEHISSVEVTVEGRVRVHEFAEDGRRDTMIPLGTLQLWTKGDDSSACPSTLPFSVTLPTMLQNGDRTYALPPSHSVKLKGIPGFDADIDYSVSVRVKSKKFGLAIGNTTLSTPFIYHPRTRPTRPIPPVDPNAVFIESPEWKMHRSVVKAQANTKFQDISAKLYLPASRIFHLADTIPFHIVFESNADSLAAFLTYGPTGHSHPTRLQLVRQSTVDVRGELGHQSKTSIWRIDYIGEGVFNLAAEGTTSKSSFSGQIAIKPVTIAGFNLRHLAVTDTLILTVAPPVDAPFGVVRDVIPVLLATDPWVRGDQVNAE